LSLRLEKTKKGVKAEVKDTDACKSLVYNFNIDFLSYAKDVIFYKGTAYLNPLSRCEMLRNIENF